MVPCMMCGRGVDAAETRFGRCPRCTDRLDDTITEATPFYGTLATIRRTMAARQADRRGR